MNIYLNVGQLTEKIVMLLFALLYNDSEALCHAQHSGDVKYQE